MNYGQKLLVKRLPSKFRVSTPVEQFPLLYTEAFPESHQCPRLHTELALDALFFMCMHKNEEVQFVDEMHEGSAATAE